ncbi:hypothetical protein [Caulobacter sp. LARHSG274]
MAQDDLDGDVEMDIESSALQEILEVEDIKKTKPLFDQRAIVNLPNLPSDEAQAKAIISQGQNYATPAATAATTLAATKQKYWRLPAAQQIAPAWATAAHNTDYRHLAGLTAPETFDLSAGVLQTLADRNAFVFSGARPVRVVGLRGLVLADGSQEAGWAQSHSVKLSTPDHLNPRCLIGLWHPSDGAIRLFSGSTVPQVANMFCSLATKGWGTSLLPCGYYRFNAGTHKAASPRPQPGALRNSGTYIVLRTTSDLTYDPFDKNEVWTFGAAHNIHAAGPGLRNPRFDSSGCQVILGGYSADRTTSYGPWKSFQNAAGLAAADGKVVGPLPADFYEYMLLTGLEASLAAAGGAGFADYRRLRPGSRGPRVQTMTQQLIIDVPRLFDTDLAPSSVFNGTVAFAVLVQQKLKSQEKEYVAPIMVG